MLSSFLSLLWTIRGLNCLQWEFVLLPIDHWYSIINLEACKILEVILCVRYIHMASILLQFLKSNHREGGVIVFQQVLDTGFLFINTYLKQLYFRRSFIMILLVVWISQRHVILFNHVLSINNCQSKQSCIANKTLVLKRLQYFLTEMLRRD